MAPIARIARIARLAALTLVFAAASQAAPDLGAAQPALDPFMSLIEKPVPRRDDIRPPVPVPLPPQPKAIAPIAVEVLALVRGRGDGTQMALIQYRGEEFLVRQGWDGAGETGFDGRFKVVALADDELVLYDLQAKRRQRVDLAERAGDGLELSAAR